MQMSMCNFRQGYDFGGSQVISYDKDEVCFGCGGGTCELAQFGKTEVGGLQCQACYAFMQERKDVFC